MSGILDAQPGCLGDPCWVNNLVVSVTLCCIVGCLGRAEQTGAAAYQLYDPSTCALYAHKITLGLTVA